MNAFSYLLLNLLIFTSAEIVEIEDGQLDGTVMTTRKNVNFHAFLNIPYAQPPIGYLRFQAPVPNNKWGGVRIAKEFGPMCMQAKRQFNVSEDCLHLNVFTKNLNSSYPVIVFIHGGVSPRNYLIYLDTLSSGFFFYFLYYHIK